MEYPQFTVIANLVRNDTKFIGQSWEFFENLESAKQCYQDQLNAGNVPTLRPFYAAHDVKHMNITQQ